MMSLLVALRPGRCFARGRATLPFPLPDNGSARLQALSIARIALPVRARYHTCRGPLIGFLFEEWKHDADVDTTDGAAGRSGKRTASGDAYGRSRRRRIRESSLYHIARGASR